MRSRARKVAFVPSRVYRCPASSRVVRFARWQGAWDANLWTSERGGEVVNAIRGLEIKMTKADAADIAKTLCRMGAR